MASGTSTTTPPSGDAKTRFIRWKAVIPAAVFVLAIFLFIYFFLDAVAKWAIKKGGEAAFGARVDIAAVKVSLKNTSLRIQGLQVANKSEPMKNLFEWRDAIFDAEAFPLLEKRVIIDQSSVTG